MPTYDEVLIIQGRIASESHGEAVFENIQQTLKEGEGRGRWFWELMQNAMDSVEDGERIFVSLTVTDSFVSFRHNGNPFRLEEILKLITQGSSKKGARDKRGRFGTGFISTYLLSRRVRITGMVVEDDSHFDFVLDRDAVDSDAFIVKQKECMKQFVDSFQTGSQDRDTSFTYEFMDEDGPVNVERGLDRIEMLIPYVLAFNDKLERISIDKKGKSLIYKRDGEEQFGAIVDQMIAINNGERRCSILKANKGDEWQVAYKLEYVDGRRVFADLPPDFPNLFYSFPLLGSEVLGLPVVIDSLLFDVRKERDGIFLGMGNDPSIITNKAVVEAAVKFLPDIIRWAVKNSVGRLYNAIFFRQASTATWLAGTWLSELKKEILQTVELIPLIWPYIRGEEPLALVNALISFHESTDVRTLLDELGGGLVPDRMPVEREGWYSFCLGYKDIMKIDKELPSFFFTWRRLSLEVQTIGTLEKVKAKMQGKKTGEEWLKLFYESLMAADQPLFKEFALIPTHAGPFSKLVVELRMDEVKDEVLLTVAQVEKKDLLAKLVPPEIVLPDGLCEGLKRMELVRQLMSFFSGQKPGAYADPALRRSNAMLLKWLIENEKGIVGVFTVVTRGKERNQDWVFSIYNLNSFVDKKQKLLAPVPFWKEEYPRFAEIVPERETLDESYLEVLTLVDLTILAEMEFIYLKPLIRWQESPNAIILEQLVKEPAQMSLLYNTEGAVVIESVEYTDFVFLGSNEGEILRSISFARSSGILAFALTEAVEKDETYEQFYPINGTAGVVVSLRQAIWVGRLKENQWVSIRKPGEAAGGYSGEKPSSQNLAALIRERPELKMLIRHPKAAKLLSLWGISIADLIRNLMTDENLKEAWDKTFTALLFSDLKPEQATEMLNDPAFLADFQKKKDRADLIRRNQGIGNKMENAFRYLFNRPEYNHLNITRKPFGSDFQLTPQGTTVTETDTLVDSDLVNAEGKEELFEVGSWLIELKATKKDYAAMTTLQGETAVKAVRQQRHYALVVLPLDGTDITEESIIDKARFVVNIGNIIEPKYNEVQQMQVQQGVLRAGTEDLEVSLEGEQLRYHIRRRVWQEGGLNLEGFLAQMVLPVVAEAAGDQNG